MKKSMTLRALLAAPALVLLAGAATAQGLPKIEWELPTGGTLRLYGQINKGVLQYDDGVESQSYGLIDNQNSNTRAGLNYKQKFGDWEFENVNEIQYAPYSSSNANVLNTSPSASDFEFTNANIRKIDFTFKNDRFGKFWLGQGSMASDGAMEIDLSGTNVIAYSSVGDSAGGQLLRFSDGELADLKISGVYANYDGDRRVRVRYDSPSFSNFTIAAAYGRNLLSDDKDTREMNLADASVTYENTISETFEVKAALAYYWQEDKSDTFGGSASVLHTPTGINFTLAAANQDRDGGGNGKYWYGKLGLLRDFVSWGATGISIDYYAGDDILINDDVTASTSDTWGIGFVQNITRANTEIWLTYRSYDYADDFASYDDGQAIFGGARFKF